MTGGGIKCAGAFRVGGPGPVLLALMILGGCSFLSPSLQSGRSGDSMVFIPGGSFFMGSEEEAGRVGLVTGVDEKPRRRVVVRPFYIDRYEVTEAQYLDFLQAVGSKKYPGYWKEAGRPDRFPEGYDSYPVSDVDWFDADAYCRWAGKRLPTEEEWEKAARGTDGRIWPWGNDFEAGRANTLETSGLLTPPEGQEKYPVKAWKAPVGSHPEDVSPYGVFDMAGNVREWTADTYRSYPGGTGRENEQLRMIRGGSYLTQASQSRVAVRLAVLPTIGPRDTDGWHSDYSYGVRCAKDAR